MARSSQATIPIPTTPLVDSSGNMTWQWVQYFQNQYQKTGAALPAASSATLQWVGGVLQVWVNGVQIGTLAVIP